jgi:acyl-coenzyme A thioesterase PaaI-like protein
MLLSYRNGIVRATLTNGESARPGRNLIVAESEAYAVRDGKEKLVAKATVTLAPVEKGK